jgi:uncharacterized protein (DUF885 family)
MHMIRPAMSAGLPMSGVVAEIERYMAWPGHGSAVV